MSLISREAAIDELRKMYHAAEEWGKETNNDEVKIRAESCMAGIIEMKLRIEKLPSAQPEKRTEERTETHACDLISRQALMKEFSDFVRASNNSDFARTPTWNDAVSLVGSLPSEEVTLCHLDSPCEYQNSDIAMPSAQPERKKGRWTVTPLFIKCSECGEAFMLMPQNYCPNCGADMRGEEG